jgi:hypothetical protein
MLASRRARCREAANALEAFAEDRPTPLNRVLADGESRLSRKHAVIK